MIINNDCLIALRGMEDNSVDSVVTDPPYGISFMNKHWDYDVPKVDVWQEVFRVLKPGGHILCACGTRTQHRMTVNIEDAGFEIRDVIAWIYGSGFPKSLDISKQFDKINGTHKPELIPTKAGNQKFDRGTTYSTDTHSGFRDISEPTCDDARQWEGWGTALKPAMELWTLARKPLSEKTVASNVLKWGTGGINIDGCRVGHDEEPKFTQRNGRANASVLSDESCGWDNTKNTIASANPQGRFPANVIHDGSEEVESEFAKAGTLKSGKAVLGTGTFERQHNGIYGSGHGGIVSSCFADMGSASRFFYCAKASKSERNRGCDEFEATRHADRNIDDGVVGDNHRNISNTLKQNFHPTVKPISLMRYLCRMITPPNGTILDPYMGSGSTGIGAKVEGFNFIGIERESDYCKIAQARIDAWEEESPAKVQIIQPTLF